MPPPCQLAFRVPEVILRESSGGKQPRNLQSYDGYELQGGPARHHNSKVAIMAHKPWQSQTALYLDLRSTLQERNCT